MSQALLLNLSQSATIIPEYVTSTIEKINKLNGTAPEDLKTEFLSILQGYQTSTEFADEEQKMRYAANVLWARYRGMRPLKEFSVVPLGYEGFRISKKGGKYSRMYLLSEGKKQTLSLFGPEAELYKTVSIGAKYSVRLGLNKDGSLSADSRAKFTNPQALNIDLLSVFRKLGVAEAPNLAAVQQGQFFSATKKTSTGEFTDNLDWKIVKGIVVGSSTGKRTKDKAGKDLPPEQQSDYASYRIMDQSVGKEETVNPDGSVSSPTFSVWTDPGFVNWAPDSEIYCIGTIAANQDKVFSMNAINVLPAPGARPLKL